MHTTGPTLVCKILIITNLPPACAARARRAQWLVLKNPQTRTLADCTRCRLESMAQGKGAALVRKVEETLLVGSDASLPLDARKLECVQRFTDLGLGRGVDGTSSKPWVEKSSFQVRRVTFDSLVGTEEGGMVDTYEDEVGSVQSLQLGMKASAVAPTTAGAVKVGVEADLNRSVSNTRRTVGKRVVNRTISFKEEFDDTLFSADAPTHHPEENWRFEERLMAWVLENLEKEYEVLCPEDLMDKLEKGKSPAALFKEWHKECISGQNGKDAEEALGNLCYEFVGHFHITHYVSCLRLGALEYSVMSEREYRRSLGLTATAGFNMANVSVNAKQSIKKFLESKSSKTIGAILDTPDGECHVPRGTYAEAVIAVEFKPISTLVRHAHLRKALTRSIAKSIEVKGDSTGEFNMQWAAGTPTCSGHWAAGTLTCSGQLQLTQLINCIPCSIHILQ